MTNSTETGKLYGIGVGPGNPEWLTLQAVRVLHSCQVIFAPRAQIKKESLALEIVKPHLNPDAVIRELTFPMSKSAKVLDEAWSEAADAVEKELRAGKDVGFITIGDCMLYSTYIYLKRALEQRIPDLCSESIPGIPAFVAAASLADIPLGEGRQPLVIVPASGDLSRVEWALESDGTVVVMKVGEKLPALREILQNHNADGPAVLASRVGLARQCIVSLEEKNRIDTETAYLSLALVPSRRNSGSELKENP